MSEAHGASVTLGNKVVVAGPYGTVTALLNMVMASFTVYANGTLFFDLRGQAPTQGTYSFTVLSYGNGTFQLRFKGPLPITVIQSAASSAYTDANLWQQVTYTANQTSQLILVYSGGAIARGSFNTAVIVLFSFLALFFPLTFIRWLVKNQQGPGEAIVNMMQDRKTFTILMIIMSIIGIIGIITVLLEPLLG